MASEISKRARLRDIIDEAFDLEEFRDLCLDLDVEYDNLPGETKKGKAGTLASRRRIGSSGRRPSMPM